MATRYRFGDSYIPHFITFAVVNWIDALSRPAYKDILINSIKHCIEHKGLEVHAWVIMNNHVHLIISSETTPLADVIRDLKKYTAMQLLEEIQNNTNESRSSWMMWLFKSAGAINPNNKIHQFWQQDNHPIILTTSNIALQKLNYIHENPVTAQIVYEPEHYVYISARDYSGGRGLLPVVSLL